jgi:hypothetical protein
LRLAERNKIFQRAEAPFPISKEGLVQQFAYMPNIMLLYRIFYFFLCGMQDLYVFSDAGSKKKGRPCYRAAFQFPLKKCRLSLQRFNDHYAFAVR